MWNSHTDTDTDGNRDCHCYGNAYCYRGAKVYPYTATSSNTWSALVADWECNFQWELASQSREFPDHVRWAATLIATQSIF